MHINRQYLAALNAFEAQFFNYDPRPVTPDEFLTRRNALLRGIPISPTSRIETSWITLSHPDAEDLTLTEHWEMFFMGIPVATCSPLYDEPGMMVSPNAIIRIPSETPVTVGLDTESLRTAVVFVRDRVAALLQELLVIDSL